MPRSKATNPSEVVEAGSSMRIDSSLPQQLPALRIERISFTALIAEISGRAALILADGDRGAHAEAGVEHPALAAKSGIQCIDLAARTAHEDSAAPNRRLRIGLGIARKAESPFQLQTRNIVRRKLGHGSWLKPVLSDVDAPAIPAWQ